MKSSQSASRTVTARMNNKPSNSWICLLCILGAVLSNHGAWAFVSSPTPAFSATHTSPATANSNARMPLPSFALTTTTPKAVSIESAEALTTTTGQRHSSSQSSSEITPIEEVWDKIGAARASASASLASLRQKMAQQGIPAFLTYTLLSNICSAACMGVAWYTFSLQTGVSPFFPGQWRPFLARYAGVVTMNQLLKPVRLGLAVGLTPYTARSMAMLERYLARDSKSVAVAVSAFTIYSLSLGFMVGGVTLASLCSGAPIFPFQL